MKNLTLIFISTQCLTINPLIKLISFDQYLIELKIMKRDSKKFYSIRTREYSVRIF